MDFKSIFLMCIVLGMSTACESNTQKTNSDTDQFENTSKKTEEWTEENILASVIAENGETVDTLSENESKSDAIDDVELYLKGGSGCGGRINCGKWEYLRNKTTRRSVKVTVKTSWRYNNETRSETKIHNTSPGEEIHLGCNAWCSSAGRQDFIRTIVGATYE